ncbi:NAD(P)/FAD-dependent oxidoreductase [Mycobacterium sp. Aquia_216]|uniref:flavin-containing monooxygenase n=1 Tax=Mycobacterium sp. Aquia_216 TaxID=2991729 RepID=UPI00227B9C58|nr:NAD(P)/FAD-dependent oxidoreductase [Mycobacterium sp. Aquia_216]WAJ45143.1 NAD(P)/FAD-dependent oxidoreductase [Mycobacterium sp. Aquia_216]
MTEHLDVVIVGAGISGVSAAWHLQNRCPTKSYAILERRDDLGGTWDLFKYPGIRSDSDMFTLGFRFKPWRSAKSIAEGADIKAYINETVDENGIDRHIRYRHRVVSGDWSDADNRWTLTVENDGQQRDITCSFLFACTGYYNYDEGYSPTFPGAEDFEGTIVHPQHWPADLDHTDKKIIVVGSGATAITLIPALVNSGSGHVTMLQRSPTYIGSLPSVDPFAEHANRLLPPRLAHLANRWKAIAFSTFQYQLARKRPAYMRNLLMTMAQRRLPKGYDVEKHFGPKYNVWDQRLCLAPDADFFRTIRHGKADVVTDTIDRFTKTGIKLTSGEELQADIIVTATGLNMQLLGGVRPTRNGEAFDLTSLMTYKGCMFSGVPNFIITFGYTNASWTLKADLVSEFGCRLLNHMDANGFETVEPVRPGNDVDELPFMDFNPGYFQRSAHLLPKSGSRAPWRLRQNYLFDMRTIRRGKIDDEGLQFSKKRAPVAV